MSTINLRDQILNLINNKPKHYSAIIKRDSELYEWVISFSLVKSDKFSEMTYSALHQENNKCSNNKIKKFKSITEGYGYCGRTKECECAKIVIGIKLKDHYNNLADSEKSLISTKRATTNRNKYGVPNTGQLAIAKENHSKFYADEEQVHNQTIKIKKTKLRKYGTSSYNNREKAETTLLSKNNVTNPMHIPSVVASALSTKKERYEPFYQAKLNHPAFIKTCLENFNVIAHINKEEYIGVKSRPLILFECAKCQHTFEKRFDYASVPVCKICHPTPTAFKSSEELELLEFVKSLGVKTISGDRSTISPYEIDILLPDLDIGIEYCGLYWHSENGGKKSWNYHHRKFTAAKAKGVSLITIFSDEWNTNKNMIKAMIETKINKNTKSIYARKTTISKISRSDALSFINENHVQGAPIRLPMNYGLYYGGTLISVMAFKKIKNSIELIRFCSSIRVQGGASKLLSKCISEHPEITEITSFSDNRHSDGNLYRVLGFDQIGTVPPMQSYIAKYTSRIHKLAASKIIKNNQKLETEWLTMQSLGYDRIWDCGKIKWRKIV